MSGKTTMQTMIAVQDRLHRIADISDAAHDRQAQPSLSPAPITLQ